MKIAAIENPRSQQKELGRLTTACDTRRTTQTFGSHLAWESEVWIAEDPHHMIHFNGGRFLGPYPDVMAKNL